MRKIHVIDMGSHVYVLMQKHSDKESSPFRELEQVLTKFTVALVQPLSHVRHFATPQTVACQASLSFTISQCLVKLMSTESVKPSNHLILCHPLLLLFSSFPSIKVFFNKLALRIRWPKYWSVSISEYARLISFRFD